jgi:hypothetical protein
VAFSTDSSRIGGGAHVKTKDLGRVTESTARLSAAIGVDSWFCGPPKTYPTETRVCAWSARKGTELPAMFEPAKGRIEERQPAFSSLNVRITGDFRAFDPLSPPEPAFRQNVWQSGARNVCRKTDDFPVPAAAALIGQFSPR